MSWASEEDLFVGTLNTSGLDTAKYLLDAEEEILVYLGQIYQLPLPALPADLTRTMKFIHQRMASGRLIMDIAMSTENNELNAYGLSLLKDGHDQLCRIGYAYEIPGAVKIGARGENRAPSVSGVDAVSPWSVYESYVHGHGTDVVKYG